MSLRGSRKTQETDVLARRPRRSLARRTLFWMGVVAVLPTLASAVIFQQLFNDYIVDSHGRDADTLATLVARSVSGRLDHRWARQHGEVLDALGREPRIAFVAVFDRRGKPLHAGVFDSAVWDTYIEMHGPTFSPRDVTGDGNTPDQMPGGIMLKTALVRSLESQITEDGRAEIEGAVLLALKEPQIRTVMWTFHSAQFGMVLLVCLIALPIMAFVMRRWTRPLRGLIEATRRLAMGRPPKPVAVGHDDEIGYLTFAFNDMAGKLLAQHRKLIDANENLEQRVKQRTAELQQAVAKLDTLARTDPLTGLANRRAFHEAIDARLAHSRLSGSDFAVVIIDLDGFKAINDSFGHDRGDELLQAVAKTIEQHRHNDDLPARMGGDEFIVLMPGTDAAAAAELADHIRARFETRSRELFDDTDPPPAVTMSLGVASYGQTHPHTADTLIAQADHALYAAKGAGKSRVVVYDPAADALADAPNEAA